MRGFIIGNPRSGTTLLRLMLNNHSDIVAPPECGFMQWWYKKYNDWTVNDSKDIKKINKYLDDLLTSKKIEDWKLCRNDLVKDIMDSCPYNYGNLSEIIYKSYSKKNGNDVSVVIDKNNYYINHLSQLKDIWPDAVYIYIVRDGRDVALSYREMIKKDFTSKYKPRLPYDIPDIAKEWVLNDERVSDFLKKIDKSKSIIIKYEDLLANEEKVLGDISVFLGLEYQCSMLEYYKNNDEPISTNAWKAKTFTVVDRNNIGKYINGLSKEEVSIFIEIAYDSMKRYGYV